MPTALNHKQRALASLNALAFALDLSRGNRLRLIREEAAETTMANARGEVTINLQFARQQLAQAHAHHSTLQKMHSDYARAIAQGVPDMVDDLGELLAGAIAAIEARENG